MATLHYASQQAFTRNIPFWRNPLLFWAGAVAASASASAFAVFCLNDYNSFLERDGTLGFDLFFMTILFTIATAALAAAIRALSKLRPDFPLRTSIRFWICAGILLGILSTLPPSLDAATYTHTITTGGNLAQRGWGTVTSISCFLGVPLFTFLAAIRLPPCIGGSFRSTQ